MDNLRDIVNGAQLPRFVNKEVSIIGQVEDMEPNGMSFRISTTDSQVIKVNVRQPISVPVTGWVEVRGISTGRGINAEDFVIFSNEACDTQACNELCTFLYSVPNIWRTS